ncbi:MAG: helix-turn-helix domain-containing protein [Christensenellales bacterium]
MSIFSERIKEILKSKGFTQKELAIQLKTNHQNVSRWCSGRVEPDFETLIKISEILDTTPNELLGLSPDFEFIRQKSEIQEIFDRLDKVNKAHLLGYARGVLSAQNSSTDKW